jgi:hypothetical protein
MSDDDSGDIGSGILIFIVVVIGVIILLNLLAITAGVGAVIGMCTAMKNYVLSFRKNVQFE